MAQDAHAKPVTSTTPPELVGTDQARFNKGDFDDVVFDKGYDVWIEKSIMCPCRLAEINNAPLTTCKNCGGIGWVFINKKKTRAVLQAMNRMVKNAPWTESDRGTISMTVRDDDKVAYMDRVTNLDLVSHYTQVVPLKLVNGKYRGYLVYDPISIEHVFLFESVETKLYKVSPTDYVKGVYQIVLNNDFSGVTEPKIAVRYQHHPQFHIIDITREQVAGRGSLEQDGNLQDPIQDRLGQLPVHAIGRRSHHVLDMPNLFGVSLFDNSDA